MCVYKQSDTFLTQTTYLKQTNLTLSHALTPFCEFNKAVNERNKYVSVIPFTQTLNEKKEKKK